MLQMADVVSGGRNPSLFALRGLAEGDDKVELRAEQSALVVSPESFDGELKGRHARFRGHDETLSLKIT